VGRGRVPNASKCSGRTGSGLILLNPGAGDRQLSVVSQDVRFYPHVICPLKKTDDSYGSLSRQRIDAPIRRLPITTRIGDLPTRGVFPLGCNDDAQLLVSSSIGVHCDL
jgi:hypothetical protein